MSNLNYDIKESITYNGITTNSSITSAGVQTSYIDNNRNKIITNYNFDFTTVKKLVNNSSSYILNNQSSSIESLAAEIPYPYGDTYFVTVFLRSYLDYLIDNNSQVVQLNNLDTYKYFNDFYGILNELGIPAQYHAIILRMNGFSDTGQYNPDITSIILPDFSVIDNLAAIYNNTIEDPFNING